MKKILLIMLSIMFAVLSCKTATAPIDSKRTGTYVSDRQINGSSYLAIAFDDYAGGFGLYYSTNKEGKKEATTKVNTAAAENISGQDPNYTFNTGVMAGSLQFISDTVVKITVNFNDGSGSLKDILCYSNK